MSSPDGVNEDGADIEALQAQIDMSLAHTQSLVSSWLKPQYGSKLASSSRLTQEKELQDILKRPARLGVGAPIPSGTSIASRDAVKLKGKLAGKKRGREDEDAKQDAPSDDEQESKASAVKKKARHDPFAPKAKKKASVPPPSASEEPVASSSPKAFTSPVKQSVDEDSPSPRKKKKKHHRPAEIQDDAVTTAKSPDISQKATEVVKTSHKTLSSPSKTGSSSQGSPLVAAKLPNAPPTSPAKSSAQDMPLLYLDGPPPVVDGSPSKRKRKRNKKKKRKTSGQTADAPGPEADPDDDASS